MLDLDAQPMVELEERLGRELPGQMSGCREQPASRLRLRARSTGDRSMSLAGLKVQGSMIIPLH